MWEHLLFLFSKSPFKKKNFNDQSSLYIVEESNETHIRYGRQRESMRESPLVAPSLRVYMPRPEQR